MLSEVANAVYYLLLLLSLLSARPVSTASEYCPPINLEGGSPLYPLATVGGDLLLYAEFSTDGDVNDLNITWSRTPSALSDSSGRYWINITILSDRSIMTNLSLTDLTNFPDYGDYFLNVESNCTSYNITFTLYLFQCDLEDIPQPVVSHHLNIIAETSLDSPLMIYMIFVGTSLCFYYPTYWTFRSVNVCTEDGKAVEGYSCGRNKYGNCSFTPFLDIANASFNSAGNYSVQAVGDDGSSGVATYELVVVQEPNISCSQRHAISDRDIDCIITNYSIYIVLAVVKGDVNVVEQYSVSEVCTEIKFEKHQAKCTIQLKKGNYKLCLKYNSSVTTSSPLYDHCSFDINVRDLSFWEKHKYHFIEGGGPAVIIILLIISILFIWYGVRKYRNPRRRYSPIPEVETDGPNHATETESVSPPTSLITTKPSEESSRRESLSIDTPTELQQRSQLVLTSSPSTVPHITANPSTQGGEVAQDAPLHSHPDCDVHTVGAHSSGSNSSTIEHAAKAPGPSLVLLYAQNPEEYIDILPPKGDLTNSQKQCLEDEKSVNENKMKDAIAKQREQVKEFAEFLQRNKIKVYYDQPIEDTHIACFPKWLEQKIEKSDYVIIVITPSFIKFLRQDRVPDKEKVFHGNYLYNLCSDQLRKPTGSRYRVVSVFLNRTVEKGLIPPSLQSGNYYGLWAPYCLGEGRHDQLQSFVSLITSRNQ